MKRIVVLFLFLIMFIGSPVQASPLEDSLIPQDSRTHSGSVELEFNKYPNSRYNVDMWIDATWNPLNVVGHISDEVQALRLDIINGVWSFERMIFNFSISVVGQAFELDLIEFLIQYIGEGIQTIAGFNAGGFQNQGLWPALILSMITLVATWAAYVFLIKREQSRALSGILSMLIIFVISLGYFANAATVLSTVNAVSKELQLSVLSISGKIMNPGKNHSGEEGVASIQNQMFDLLIKKPYLLMQYGTADIDPVRADSILQLDYNSEARNQLVKEEVTNKNNVMMGTDGLKDRTWFVFLQLINGCILSVQTLLLSGSVVFFQAVFIGMVMVSPVPLLMSLVPAWRDTAMTWGLRTLKYLLMKVGIALLMTVIFTVAALAYKALQNQRYGFLIVSGVQIVIYIGIWIKRKELFSFATSIGKGNFGNSSMMNYMKMRTAGRFAKTAFNGMKGMVQSKPTAPHSPSVGWSPANRGASEVAAAAAERGGTEVAAVAAEPGENNKQAEAVSGGVARRLVLVPGMNRKNVEASSTDLDQSISAPSGTSPVGRETAVETRSDASVHENSHGASKEGTSATPVALARRKPTNRSHPVLHVSRDSNGKISIGQPKDRQLAEEDKKVDSLQKSPRYFHEAKKYTETPMPEPPSSEERSIYDPDDISWDYDVASLRADAIKRSSERAAKGISDKPLEHGTKMNKETIRHNQAVANRREYETTVTEKNEAVERQHREAAESKISEKEISNSTSSSLRTSVSSTSDVSHSSNVSNTSNTSNISHATNVSRTSNTSHKTEISNTESVTDTRSVVNNKVRTMNQTEKESIVERKDIGEGAKTKL